MRLVHRYPNLLLRSLVADQRAIERYLEIPLRNLSYEQFLLWLMPRLVWRIMRGI